MNRRKFVLFGSATVLLGLLFVDARADSEVQAQEMVAKAVSLYDQKGDEALPVYSEGEAGGFKKGEVYIVVQTTGPNSAVLAHAANPKLIGTPLKDIVDPTGLRFALEMSNRATSSGGWFEYQWQNPDTGQVQMKRSWAVLHKELVFIAGYYKN
jgi:hypothetical protein